MVRYQHRSYEHWHVKDWCSRHAESSAPGFCVGQHHLEFVLFEPHHAPSNWCWSTYWHKDCEIAS